MSRANSWRWPSIQCSAAFEKTRSTGSDAAHSAMSARSKVKIHRPRDRRSTEPSPATSQRRPWRECGSLMQRPGPGRLCPTRDPPRGLPRTAPGRAGQGTAPVVPSRTACTSRDPRHRSTRLQAARRRTTLMSSQRHPSPAQRTRPSGSLRLGHSRRSGAPTHPQASLVGSSRLGRRPRGARTGRPASASSEPAPSLAPMRIRASHEGPDPQAHRLSNQRGWEAGHPLKRVQSGANCEDHRREANSQEPLVSRDFAPLDR